MSHRLGSVVPLDRPIVLGPGSGLAPTAANTWEFSFSRSDPGTPFADTGAAGIDCNCASSHFEAFMRWLLVLLANQDRIADRVTARNGQLFSVA